MCLEFSLINLNIVRCRVLICLSILGNFPVYNPELNSLWIFLLQDYIAANSFACMFCARFMSVIQHSLWMCCATCKTVTKHSYCKWFTTCRFAFLYTFTMTQQQFTGRSPSQWWQANQFPVTSFPFPKHIYNDPVLYYEEELCSAHRNTLVVLNRLATH